MHATAPRGFLLVTDGRFEPLAKVLVASLRTWGGACAAYPVHVLDAGLTDWPWFAARDCTHTPLGELDLPLLPPAQAGEQHTLNLMLAQLVGLQQSPFATTWCLDADEIVLGDLAPAFAAVEESSGLGGHHGTGIRLDGAGAARALYLRDTPPPAWWNRWLPLADGTAGALETINAGDLITTSPAVDALAPELTRLCQAYTDPDWLQYVQCWGADQLALTYAAARAGLTLCEVPPRYSLHRMLALEHGLGFRDNTAFIDGGTPVHLLHLSGPIKPGLPGGEHHPMTYIWRHKVNELQTAGRL